MARRSGVAWALAVCALLAVACSVCEAGQGDVESLVVDVLDTPSSCIKKADEGDLISVHYKGMLTDGTVFDSSYDRGEPFEFVLGAGQVIQGWDQGLIEACAGEKRKLHIPPHMAYGDEGVGPIPGGSTLIFDIEIVDVRANDGEGSYGGAYDGGAYGDEMEMEEGELEEEAEGYADE